MTRTPKPRDRTEKIELKRMEHARQDWCWRMLAAQQPLNTQSAFYGGWFAALCSVKRRRSK